MSVKMTDIIKRRFLYGDRLAVLQTEVILAPSSAAMLVLTHDALVPLSQLCSWDLLQGPVTQDLKYTALIYL